MPVPYPFLFYSPKTHTASPEEPTPALQLGEDIHNLAPVYGQETAVGRYVVLKGHSHGDGVAAFLISTQLPVSELGHGAAPKNGPWEGRQQDDDTEEHPGPSHHGL